MNEELEQYLKNLHLRKVCEIFDEEHERASKEQISYQDFLLRLLRPQWHAKQEQALEWRIRNARLPERWPLETFPFKEQTGVNHRQIMGFAELDFIPRAENKRGTRPRDGWRRPWTPTQLPSPASTWGDWRASRTGSGAARGSTCWPFRAALGSGIRPPHPLIPNRGARR